MASPTTNKNIFKTNDKDVEVKQVTHEDDTAAMKGFDGECDGCTLQETTVYRFCCGCWGGGSNDGGDEFKCFRCENRMTECYQICEDCQDCQVEADVRSDEIDDKDVESDGYEERWRSSLQDLREDNDC